MYAFLGGAVAGTVLYALLNTAGLHWLAWPAVGALFLVGLVLTLWKRRRS